MSQEIPNEITEALAEAIRKRFKDSKAKGFFAIVTETGHMRWAFVDMGPGETLDRMADMRRAVLDLTKKQGDI